MITRTAGQSSFIVPGTLTKNTSEAKAISDEALGARLYLKKFTGQLLTKLKTAVAFFYTALILIIFHIQHFYQPHPEIQPFLKGFFIAAYFPLAFKA